MVSSRQTRLFFPSMPELFDNLLSPLCVMAEYQLNLL
jgi:hypothetical protein